MVRRSRSVERGTACHRAVDEGVSWRKMIDGENFKFHIIGAGRGGTSLLAGLVDTHPGLRVLMEKYSMAYLVGRVRTQAEEAATETERTRIRVGNFLEACREEAAASPHLMFGHKTTTEQIRALSFPPLSGAALGADAVEQSTDTVARQFAQSISESKVIFIMRDGRSCVRSKIRRAGRTTENAVLAWRYSVRAFHALREACPDFHWMKFESLLEAPESVLRGVCDFLQIEYDPVMLKGTSNPRIKKEYRRPGFDLSAMRIDGCDASATNAMADDLRFFGYLD